jgi:hypothetical protein
METLIDGFLSDSADVIIKVAILIERLMKCCTNAESFPFRTIHGEHIFRNLSRSVRRKL